jgi:hypothetical protein
MDNPPREISYAEINIKSLDQTHETMLKIRTEDTFNDSSIRKQEDSGRMPLENIELSLRRKFFYKLFIAIGGLVIIALITFTVVFIIQRNKG